MIVVEKNDIVLIHSLEERPIAVFLFRCPVNTLDLMQISFDISEFFSFFFLFFFFANLFSSPLEQFPFHDHVSFLFHGSSDLFILLIVMEQEIYSCDGIGKHILF